MKVLVCDDRKKGAGERVRREIESTTGHEAELLSARSLEKAIGDFFKWQVAPIFEGEYSTQTPKGEISPFMSDFDILILDNNLSALDFGGTRQTAESIAGYLRAFGNIPYIVSLNKNPHVDFDLRYLVGDYETQADLAVNQAHLSNLALWTGAPKDAPEDGFLPWYWPALNHLPDRRRGQIKFVRERLDAPILGAMHFPPSASVSLSRDARAALAPESERLSAVTFTKFFVTACRSLPIRPERQKLAKAAAGDRVRDIVARVVAGELDRWFRRDLLGPQDVLVDLPHLLMRMPFLLHPHAHDLQHWNHALTLPDPPYGLSADLYEKHVKPTEVVYGDWTKSPSFWWRDLKSNAELNRMFFGDTSPWAEAVFCEDISRFRLRGDEPDHPPSEFVTEFDGSWNRRYVANLRRKHYTPRSRLAK